MNKLFCFFMLIVGPIYSSEFLQPPKIVTKGEIKSIEIDEVYSPVLGEQRKQISSTSAQVDGPTIFDDMDDKNIILDINDPRVQEVIRRMVSMSIHEAFKNKELQKELENKKKCCTSSTKLKVALLTASFSTATAIITIILNNM